MISSDVQSSNIKRVGWHRMTVFIEFNNGGCYAYEHVSLKEYNALVAADSVGSYFYHEFRSRFPYKKLDVNPFEAKVTQEPTLKKINFQPALSH